MSSDSSDANIEQSVLSRLADVLEQRKSADSDSSYVASLYHKGLDQILKKIGEEALYTKQPIYGFILWFYWPSRICDQSRYWMSWLGDLVCLVMMKKHRG